MGKQFGNKRGFKRLKKHPGKFELSRFSKKNGRVEEEERIAHGPLPSSLGELSEEENGNLSPVEEIVYKEPSTYGKLLNMLGFSSKSVDDANKQRQRQEEGKSNTEQDEDMVMNRLVCLKRWLTTWKEVMRNL